MGRTTSHSPTAPAPSVDERGAIVGYVGSDEGKRVIDRGLADIRAGRVLTGEGALGAELKRRAAARQSRA